MKRREILLGSGGVAVALLAGRVPTAQAQNEPTTDLEQSADRESAIGLLPAQSTLDVEYGRIRHVDVGDADETGELTYHAAVIDRIDGLEVSDVDSVATAWTDEQLSIGGISGSFERPEPGEPVDEPGEWHISDDEDAGLAVASTDDLVLFVQAEEEDDRVDAVETSCDVARQGGETALDATDLLGVAFDRLGDSGLFYFIDDIEMGLPTSVSEKIRTFGAGFEEPPSEIRGHDGTLENEYLLEQAADADLDDEEVEEVVQELEQGMLVDTETEFDDDLVFVQAVVEAPPERNREGAPDASVMMEGNSVEGTAELEHRSGEPIPADSLELWVNGELAGVQPADEFDEFAPGDSLTADTGSLASVFLRWFDEADNEYYEYVNDVVGANAFDVSHDPGAETVELTYTSESEVDSELLKLTHRKQVEEDDVTRIESEQLTEPVESLGDSLSTGDTIVVDGVELEDTVVLNLDVPARPAGSFGPNTSVVRFRARAPRLYVRRRPDEDPVVEYRDETARDADEFRVLLDGSETDTQPADEHDTLEPGDSMQLGGVEFGGKIVIEWLVGDEPVVVEEHEVEPLLHLESSYDDEDGTVTVEHHDGESVDADALELRVGDSPAETQPGDQHDAFGQGDTVTATAEPFARVEVRWREGETEVTLSQTVIGEDLFEASYDPDAESVELVYVGEEEADPSQLRIERFGTAQQNDEAQLFEGIETLTNGDSVTVDGVSADENIQIVHSGEGSGRNAVFHFAVEPAYAFAFEERDGTLTAEYNGAVSRDADEFRMLVDGSEADTQPSDEHDTLERGDTVELGSYPTGTTVVVEWPASAEATEIQRHVVVPDAEFDASYDADEEELHIEHVGGDEIDAADLGIHAPPVTEGVADWDGDGTVSEGDSTTIDVEEEPQHVIVTFREREVLYRTVLGE